MGTPDPRDVLTRPATAPDQVIRYGPDPDQVADLRLPPLWGVPGAASRGGAVLVLLLHGGFWRAAFDRTHTGPMAAALAAESFVVCTPEFRRVGQAGGGWPGTFDDVAAAVDVLPGLVASAVPGAPRNWRVVLAGHSAGGHLALWSAGRPLLAPGNPWRAEAGRVAGVVALAPVSDLAACSRQGLGDHAADHLLGGGPEQQPERYAAADPARMIPLGVRLRVVHGSDDDRVPCAMSRRFTGQARAAGDDAALTELPGTGHFEVIDPLSPAWPAVLDAFRSVAMPG